MKISIINKSEVSRLSAAIHIQTVIIKLGLLEAQLYYDGFVMSILSLFITVLLESNSSGYSAD